MFFRTWVHDEFDAYLEAEYPHVKEELATARAEEIQERTARMELFPYAVLLQVACAEKDFANRWCWQQFGPSDGQCLESYSEYPACTITGKHEHKGIWATYWLAKTSYNFGYNEWYFASEADRDRFVGFLPQLNWGEAFPKQPQPL